MTRRVMFRVFILLVFPLTAASGEAIAMRSARGHDGSPELRLVSKPGYTLAIGGTGWPPKRRAVFALTQSQRGYGLELRTSAKGDFLIGVKNIDLCNGINLRARDFAGNSATLTPPPRECPVSQLPPDPRLSVLIGKSRAPAVKRVDFPPVKQTRIRIKRADAVYLWQAGTEEPMFVPSAPTRYLFRLAAGRTPARDCPEKECAAGFFQEWVGMKVGETSITMNPSCRPQCEVPSFLLPVEIKHR